MFRQVSGAGLAPCYRLKLLMEYSATCPAMKSNTRLVTVSGIGNQWVMMGFGNLRMLTFPRRPEAARHPPDRQEVSAQADRILSSAGFRESAIQTRLLRFLTQRQLDGRGRELKESTLAVEVFGRPGDFDSRTDNTVRMNVSRLRGRLSDYYASEGAADPVVIEVPRGSYAPLFRWRKESAPVAGAFRKWLPLWGCLAFLAAGIAVGWGLAGWHSGQARSRALGPAVQSFYARFWDKPTLLVYRNPTFLRMESEIPLLLLYGGHSAGSMSERLPLPSDAPDQIRKRYEGSTVTLENVWTDTGSVEAVFALSRVFGDGGAAIGLQNTQNVDAEQCRDRNLIVVSPPWFNQFVGQLPPLQLFEFDVRISRIAWKGPPGQRKDYESQYESQTGAMRRTWGFVALEPGLSPGTRTLRISGVSPLAVHGAAKYMTAAASLQELARALGDARTLPDAFEALLRVESLNGQVAAVHFERGAKTAPAK